MSIMYHPLTIFCEVNYAQVLTAPVDRSGLQKRKYLGVAQLAARVIWDHEVGSSSPPTQTSSTHENPTKQQVTSFIRLTQRHSKSGQAVARGEHGIAPRTHKKDVTLDVKDTYKPQFSKTVGDFCSFLENAQKDYTWNYDEVGRMDALTQDYLHKLELEGLDYAERAKVATQLTKCRQARRASKDTTQVLEPLVQFLDSEKGKQLYNLLREILGKTRKVEERMETRFYRPRVLK